MSNALKPAAHEAPATRGRMTMCEEIGASHAFLEQPGKLRLLLRGQSLSDLAAEGARALGDRLCGRASRAPLGPWVDVEVHASSREAVIADWLNRLLYLAHRNHWAPTECQLLAVSDSGIRARVRGTPLGEKPCLSRAMIRPNSISTPGWCRLQVQVILQPPAASGALLRLGRSRQKKTADTKGRQTCRSRYGS